MSVQAFETSHKVRGYDCGYGGPFRPLSLANYLQEAAGDHAAILGVGMSAMFDAGRTWMLSRIDILLKSLPRSGEELVVRTWPAGTHRLFALRHLCLLSASGELLAGARYDYLIVDMERRRPLRPERIIDPGMVGDYPPPCEGLSPGLQDESGFEAADLALLKPSFSVQASPRHIDYNGHVNNAHIIDWLCDAPPAENRASGALARLKVDFVAELKQGEIAEALSWEDGGRTKSALLRGGELVAKATIDWAGK
jgi:medium-chain acyl-[acyl-carrier-protein] hydrolase